MAGASVSFFFIVAFPAGNVNGAGRVFFAPLGLTFGRVDDILNKTKKKGARHEQP
jgi:hypothetical protein